MGWLLLRCRVGLEPEPGVQIAFIGIKQIVAPSPSTAAGCFQYHRTPGRESVSARGFHLLPDAVRGAEHLAPGTSWLATLQPVGLGLPASGHKRDLSILLEKDFRN